VDGEAERGLERLEVKTRRGRPSVMSKTMVLAAFATSMLQLMRMARTTVGVVAALAERARDGEAELRVDEERMGGRGLCVVDKQASGSAEKKSLMWRGLWATEMLSKARRSFG
jgi:hypothetical protein